MSNNQAIDVKQSSQSKKQEPQHVDVGQFAKRLSFSASNTAQALYAVAHLSGSVTETMVIGNLAYKSFALAAALSSLADDLIPGESEHFKEQDVWTKDHHKNLLCSFTKCEGIFSVIDSAVGWADEHFVITNGPTKGEDWIDRFALNNQHKALMSVKECYDLVMQTKMVARHAALTRKEHRVDGGPFETLRLTRALQHPVLAGIRVSKDGPSVSEQSQTFSTPSNAPSASAVNAPKAEPRSSPPSSCSQNEDLGPKNPTPITAYNQWPPFNNSQHPAYLDVMASQPKDSNNTAVAESSTAPASTFVGKTVPGPSTSWDLPSSSTPHAEPATIAFGQPSRIRPASYSKTLFGKTTPTGGLANYNQSNANPFTPTPHLEAYILNLTVTSTNTASTLSYEVESLRLSQEALEAQARSMVPNSSIMDVLLDLHPQEMLLIQLYAQKRQGHILCVEHRKPVTLSILMGNLQFRPIMFIIYSTAMLPQDPSEASFTAAARSDPMPTAGENLGGNLFENTAWQGGFGSSNTGIVGGPTHHLSTPEGYSQYLQEKGDPCIHVERDNFGGAFQHFQTITANKGWHNKDHSFEEIRLADYNTVRKVPVKTNDVPYSWNQTRNLFEGLDENNSSLSALSAEVRTPQTCFPTTISLATQNKDTDKQVSNQGGLPPVPSRRAPHSAHPFAHVAPELQMVAAPTSGSLFGAPADTAINVPFGTTPTAQPQSGGPFDRMASLNPAAVPTTNLSGAPSGPPSNPVGPVPAAPSSASCALFGTPSTTSTAARRPETGSFGGNTNIDSTPPVTSSSFGWSTGKPSLPGTTPAIPAQPASGPWGQSSGTASASASVPIRVKHTSSEQRLQDYRRQLREHEERVKLSLLAKRTASRPPFDDATLDVLLRLARNAPASPWAEKGDDKDDDKDKSEKSPHVTDSAFGSNLTAQVATAPKTPEDDSSSTGKDHEDLFGARLENTRSAGDARR